MFGGYPMHAYDWLADYLQPVPGWLRRAAQRRLKYIPAGLRRLRIAARSLLEPDQARRWTSWFGAFSAAELVDLLSPDLAAAARESPASRHFEERLALLPGVDALGRMLYLDAALWLPDNLLMRDDRMSMAASVEARMPFLDTRLLDLVASVPGRRRVRRFGPKHLLKEAYVGTLPRELLYRRKVGFAVPISMWFRSRSFGFLSRFLNGERARARGLFRAEAVEALLQEHLNRSADHHWKLFNLLAIELWHRAHIDAEFIVAPGWEDIMGRDELDQWRRAC